MQVLIADDSAIARMFVKRCAQVAGLADAEFTEAKDGAEAFELATGRDFDLCFMDLNMPKVHGREVLANLAARGTKLRVVVISSAVNEHVRKELTQLGAFRVISKPFSPAELGEVIASATEVAA
ncbi:MAG: response regulator [Polyangiaceae bacterium]|nr:response regulator [Polyangiaceae bacterium]